MRGNNLKRPLNVWNLESPYREIHVLAFQYKNIHEQSVLITLQQDLSKLLPQRPNRQWSVNYQIGNTDKGQGTPQLYKTSPLSKTISEQHQRMFNQCQYYGLWYCLIGIYIWIESNLSYSLFKGCLWRAGNPGHVFTQLFMININVSVSMNR